MRLAYVDTSALVSVLFGEARSMAIRKKLKTMDVLFSSSFLEAELLAVLAREKRPLVDAEGALGQVSLVFPSASLRAECTEVLQYGYVRGADLWHLATAVAVAGSPEARRGLLFLSLDGVQHSVAGKMGFAVWPA